MARKGVTIMKALKKAKRKTAVAKSATRTLPLQTSRPYNTLVTTTAPMHGVSGYANTGVAGDYNFVIPSSGISQAVGPNGSRYGVQFHTPVGFSNFNEPTHVPMGNISTPTPNPGNFTSEPAVSYVASALESSRMKGTWAGTPVKGYFSGRVKDGFADNDPVVKQELGGANVKPEAPFTPVQGGITGSVGPATATRNGDVKLGTINPTVKIEKVTPRSQNSHAALAHPNTPSMMSFSNVPHGAHYTTPSHHSGGHTNTSNYAQVTTTQQPIMWQAKTGAIYLGAPPPILPAAPQPIPSVNFKVGTPRPTSQMKPK